MSVCLNTVQEVVKYDRNGRVVKVEGEKRTNGNTSDTLSRRIGMLDKRTFKDVIQIYTK